MSSFSPQALILFDGVCNLCNGSVRFILERDSKAYFRFACLQSDYGQECLKRFGIEPDVESIIFIENEKAYRESGAVLRIARHLRGFWSWAYCFLAVPAFLRNAVYRFVAKHRYRWFGQREECMVPTPEISERFLG